MSIDYQGNGGGVPRKTAKIFASNADSQDVTVFGSTLAEDTTYTTDIAEIQNSAFETGWRDAIISNLNYPLLADMNGVQKTLSQQIAYILQHGIPAYDSGTTYYAYDKVLYNDIIYTALQDNFSNHAPSDNTYWAEYYNPNKGALRNIGEIVSSAIPLTDAGLHLLDGSLINGSGIYAEFVNYIGDLFENSPKVLNLGVYGSPTINNGVVSGFSTSPASCVTTTGTSVPTSFSTFEIDLKFTTGSITADQAIISYGNEANKGLAVGITASTGTIYFFASSDGTNWDIANGTGAGLSSLTVSANTTYYMKVYFTGTDYKVDLSTDGETYTNYISVTSSTAMYKSSFVDFGVWYNNGVFYNAFSGSIDFNYFKLIQDDIEVWTGMLPSWCCDETQWQTTNTAYGSCGKFVYTSASGGNPATVRLPKITNILEGTTDLTALGDLIEAGLPSIDHTHSYLQTTQAGSGWSYDGGNYYYGQSWATTSTNSAVNNIYGKSNTVQPQTVKCLYYVVIASLTKTDIEVDIDEIATDLNGKAGVDLINVNATGTSLASSWSMPSNTYVDLTVGASGASYTAPANGWFTAVNSTAHMGWAVLHNVSNGLYSTGAPRSGLSDGGVFMPVRKGDTVYLSYIDDYGSNFGGYMRFVYAEGEA